MTTIKVTMATRDRLRQLAEQDHVTMDVALARALDEVETARFWLGVREDYARLRADPREWASYTGELAAWDATAGDGIDSE